MSTRKQLASDAIVKALQTRKKLNYAYDESISPLDAAERLGVEVRLADLPSMEGMYVSGKKPTIVLSSLRPPGRRAFTCAHELGHHVFGHGEQFDELLKIKSSERRMDPKELQADCFAAFFLMPKHTIDQGMSLRNYRYDSLTPAQVFELSNWLGVSYGALVNQLVWGLGKISQHQGARLLKVPPQEIRRQICPGSDGVQLLCVNQHWKGRAIDCEVGDRVLFEDDVAIEARSDSLTTTTIGGYEFSASVVGLARVSFGEWSAFMRISPHGYSGRACYQFEEEVD